MFPRQLICILAFLTASAMATAQAQDEHTTDAKDSDKTEDVAHQLVKAAVTRDRDRIKDLLADGADINARDEFGLTPYLAASMKGNDKIAKMLEVLGAKTDVELDGDEFLENLLKKRTSPDKPGIAVRTPRSFRRTIQLRQKRHVWQAHDSA